MKKLNSFFKIQIFELIYLLILKEFKIRYKNSFFGYVWAVANPLAFAFIYYFAFKIILRSNEENFVVYLLAGVFPWAWLSSSINHGTNSLITNVGLIKKININRALIPFTIVLNNAIHFILSVPIILLIILINNSNLFYGWFWQIPFMTLIQILFLSPLVISLSILNVLIRDIEYLIALLISMLFFLTPIVYSSALVPKEYIFIYNLNPFLHLIESWHLIFIQGTLSFHHILNLFYFFGITTLITLFIYKKYAKKVGELA